MSKTIKLLPHQYDLLEDTKTKIVGLISGYGGGKTYAACRKAIQLAHLNVGEVGIITEPTYPMLRDIFIPEMQMALQEWGIEYKFNKSNSIFTLLIGGVETKIICMSAENYERIVGINAAWAIMDEFDTSKMEIAIKAFEKILGRLRAGTVRQLIITTTPEGFKAAYEIFVKQNQDGSKRLIKAKTTDNKYLPSDFIDTLREQYPPNLLEAYLNGEFINLNNETVYSYFNREVHHRDLELKPYEVIHVGQDFNYNGCISTCFVIRDGFPIAFEEIVSKDTYGIVDNLNRFKGHTICIYPDASGNANKTNSSETDITILRKAGFTILANKKNPLVRDRINSVNALFSHNKLFIDTNKCPRLTEALEQQAYDDKGEPEKYGGAATIDDFNDSLGYFIYYKFPLLSRGASTVEVVF